MFKNIVSLVIVSFWFTHGIAQRANDPPQFLPGGDLALFSIREDTPVGSSVYKLLGADPEGTDVTFTISGDYFTIDRGSGVITLVKALDRENVDTLEVIVTVTDGKVFGLEPQTVPLRKEIPVIDVNDNKPIFRKEPYSFTVFETVTPGATLFSDISITDDDDGPNSEIRLICVEEESPEACGVFDVRAARTGTGNYIGIVSLRAALDYEKKTSYTIKLRAEDGGGLSSTSFIDVYIQDVQDRPPIMLNAPYAASLPENTAPYHTVFSVRARDGDTGSPRPVRLSIEGDDSSHFALNDIHTEPDGTAVASVVTSSNLLDREDPDISQNGGVYIFYIRAEEIGGNGDYTREKVVIIITDIDDQQPTFSNDFVNIEVSENILDGTPLPGLNLIVNDNDIGENSAFQLELEGENHIFSVSPKSAIGRAPVVIKVMNSSALDYEDPNANQYQVKVIAIQNGQAIADATINITVMDANDNSPQFSFPSYRYSVAEDIPPGKHIAVLQANDTDSGKFGNMTYSMKGFGAEKFYVNSTTGEISVSPCGTHITCLDYERQSLYSLAYTATDGGGRATSVAVFIDVVDKNDNAPVFDVVEYKRTVDEKTEVFDPPLIVKATDVDGKEQGDGKITFSIHDGNTKDNAFSIDENLGEILITRPLTHMDTPSSIYTLTVRATDGGKPARYNDIRVIITVGRDKNRPPRFTKSLYYAKIPETAQPGTEVVIVRARDPDGDDAALRYRMGFGAGDHFKLDERTGLISVAETANLNRDIEKSFLIKIFAMDGGLTKQTSTSEVNITLGDINNQQPSFDQKSYVAFVNERAAPNTVILKTGATDPDDSAKLIYKLTEPLFAYDRTGVLLRKNSSYDYGSVIGIKEKSGELYVIGGLDHNEAAVIVLTVQVEDIAADSKYPNQSDQTEVTAYIQVFSDKNPIFPSPWTPTKPIITVDLEEEEPTGVDLFAVSAKDPISGRQVRRYEKVGYSDADNIFDLDPLSGKVSLNSKLDYDKLTSKKSFDVLAIAGDRTSQATVVINLKDINDNNPQFTENEYHTRLSEDARWPKVVLTVTANDPDTGEHGSVRYSLGGEDKILFVINETTGEIRVARGARLDRESTPIVTLEVTAYDTPSGGATRRKTTVLVKIELVDVNDEMPKWTNDGKYSAVIAENSPPGTHVITVQADDPDLGVNGIVQYLIPEMQGDIGNLFNIDGDSGDVTVKASLGGKGRSTPYELRVRAVDGGIPQQFSEATVTLFIGDVSINDGVPMFISPQSGDIATVMENSREGTAVYQVEAVDADSSESANGKIVYSFLDGSEKNRPFVIDASTGLITAKGKLDREIQDQYSVVIVAQDLGRPPQITTRTLLINVTDVDDNDPIFEKHPGKKNVELEVEEEAAMGTIIGYVSAVDRDVGDNALINYKIIEGNSEGLIGINRTDDNRGKIFVTGRIDREKVSDVSITIACGKMGSRIKANSYSSSDPSLLSVVIKVLDLDDNRPMFKQDEISTGIRIDAPLQTEIVRLKAVDKDPTSLPIRYSLYNASVLHLKEKQDLSVTEPINGSDIFLLEEASGILRTRAFLNQYSGDVFTVYVAATSNPNEKAALAKLTIYVLRDADLLRFVFDATPKDVREKIGEFQNEVEKALPVNDPLKVYEANYLSDTRGKIYYEKTSSCFQLIGRTVDETKNLLDGEKNDNLKKAFQRFSMTKIQPCLPKKFSRASIDWVEIWVLVIAALVGIGVTVASFAVCCLYSRYKQRLRRTTNQMRLLESPHLAPSVIPGSILMLPTSPSPIDGSTVLHQPPPLPLQDQRRFDWHDQGFDNVSYGSIGR